VWKGLRFVRCLHLARVAVLPDIAGLRKRVVALRRLRDRVGFLRFSLLLVECLLGDSKFVHNRSACALIERTVLLAGGEPCARIYNNVTNRPILVVKVEVLNARI
jgi:hypothetical protein